MVSLPVLPPTPTNIDHTVIGAVVEGATSDLNVQNFCPHWGFGNNWLFFIPTSGPDAGAVVPLPMAHRCEMTGPTFVGIR